MQLHLDHTPKNWANKQQNIKIIVKSVLIKLSHRQIYTIYILDLLIFFLQDKIILFSFSL